MLDKLLLNNQIITNKKKIQQARIQTINKLVQKIRRLKILNEKKPNNAKITENLDKTPKVMACVKKIKIMDIIRKVLTLSKKPAAIITNGQAPPDEIAVALLANNKILAGMATTLRTLLHLDDNNPGWKDEIMELSKRKKKLLQGGKNKKLGKAEKKPAVRKNPWKEENLENKDVSNKTPDNDEFESAKGWNVETITNANEDGENKHPKVVKKKALKKEIEDQNDSIQESPESQQFNPKPVTIVDSFFLTEGGDNYMSTVVIDRVQPDAPDDGLIRRERRNNAMRPYQRNNDYKRQSGRIDKRQSFTSSFKVKPQPQVTEEKLHPSWAAKQKLKPIITQFTGQKITFDDNGQDSTVKSSGRNAHKISSNATADKVHSQDNLHPSWAAKQKLKPAIAEFKGKKITFDD